MNLVRNLSTNRHHDTHINTKKSKQSLQIDEIEEMKRKRRGIDGRRAGGVGRPEEVGRV
jgi:hypothetical protein